MFTGLVEGIGRIKDISSGGGDVKLYITPLFDISDCRPGDSISVNGVCLTVTELRNGSVCMDVSNETLSSSTLGGAKQGDEVNIERALTLSDRLGGHLVSGHVDGIGIILKKEKIRGSWRIRIGIDETLVRYTIEKGSIAVDGISLTINRCRDTFFEVNVIPETGRETTILRKKEGGTVNIETDVIAKYIEKLLKKERVSEKDAAGSYFLSFSLLDLRIVSSSFMNSLISLNCR